MDKTFQVNVNGAFSFDITKETVTHLDVLQTSKSKFHLLHNHATYTPEIIAANFHEKNYQVKINNTIYDVNIAGDLDRLIKTLGFESQSAKNINTIEAPMPGLILDIPVSVGQEVNENAPLLILEAMKMENIITSPRDGVIKSIAIKKGEAVTKQQLLIEFDA